MVKKLIILLLVLLVWVDCSGQLASHRPVNVPFDMFSPTGEPTQKRVVYAILFESSLLVMATYFRVQGNHEGYNATRIAFITSTVPLLTISLTDRHGHRRTRHK